MQAAAEPARANRPADASRRIIIISLWSLRFQPKSRHVLMEGDADGTGTWGPRAHAFAAANSSTLGYSKPSLVQTDESEALRGPVV